MINPFTAREVNILNNIPSNVEKKQENSQKSNGKVGSVLEAVGETLCSKEEHSSVSSRSSQSELSDVVKLNGTATAVDTASGMRGNNCSTLESKSMIAMFIGDLDPAVTEDMLRQIFGKFKSLTSVKLCLDSVTKASLGYGYLNFADKGDAERATEEFNYRPIKGKEVRIMPSLRNSFYRKNVGTNVFFSNLPLENSKLTTRVFYDTFKKYGKILSCKLDKRKDIGFIYFDNDQSARKVIKDYNGSTFFGNKILCGIHFDKDFRKFPEFERRISKLDSITVRMEELTTEGSEKVVEHNSGSKVPHPNAVFVKNLPIDCTNDDILEYFSRIGPVKSVFSSKAQKFNSLWAFVTYKRGSDTNNSIQYYNNKIYRNKRLDVSKAVPREERTRQVCKYRSYRTTIQIDDVSPILNEEFLTQMCIQERIKVHRLQMTFFDQKVLTYSGFIKCKTKSDATRLFELLNNRLIGGSVIRCSWKRYDDSTTSSNTEFKVPNIQQPQVLPFPICPPLYYPMKEASASFLRPQVPFNPNPHIYNEQQRAQILDYLKRQVRRGIDFLKYPSATKDDNLSCITEYIFDVYWRGDIDSLTKFMLLMNTNTQNEGILQKQIREAANFLGFGR